MPLKKGDIIDRYEILGEIGEGGMAVVYCARHNILHSNHAIKILHEQYARQAEVRTRFLMEGRIQARLRHPYIAPITDIIALPGIAGLVMPLLEGEDLDEYIRINGPIPVPKALTWARQILSALSHVHEESIVHRDLKPANIFLECMPTGTVDVRVMDFGIAKSIDSSNTRTAMAMGTPAYMSPEQIRSPKDVDKRTDLFAVGAILYEMLAGSPAFQGDTEFDIQSRIVQGLFQPLPTERLTLPGSIGAIITKALAVSPDDRYQNASEFDAVLGGLALVSSIPQAIPADPWLPKRAPSILDVPYVQSFQAKVTVSGRWEPSGTNGGGRTFIPYFMNGPKDLHDKIRRTISRDGSYQRPTSQFESGQDSDLLVWLINEEREGAPDPPEDSPKPQPQPRPIKTQQTTPVPTPQPAMPQVMHSDSTDWRQTMSIIGGIVGFISGLPAGGIGALPGAMIGSIVGYWLPELGCIALGLLGVAVVVLLMFISSI